MTIKVYKKGDEEFQLEFTMLKPSQSLKFLIFMSKILGSGAGKVAGSFEGMKTEDLLKTDGDDLNLEKIGDALFGIFDRLDEDEVVNKLNILLGSVRHGENVVNVDYFMFDGRPDLLLKVAGTALGVNYKDFLREISGAFSKIPETLRILKNMKKSQTEPT